MASPTPDARAQSCTGWWTIMQACDAARVTRRTIYNWIAAGKVTYGRTAGGCIRIDPDSVFRAPESAARATPEADVPLPFQRPA